jgi:uncharacterized protein (TIGR02391 family)
MQSPLDESHLEAICEVLGDTSAGLTGSEIGRYLDACGIKDSNPGLTKRYRLFTALQARQATDGCSNNVLAFIKKVMNPVRYHANPTRFDEFCQRLNKPLAFVGYQVDKHGELLIVSAARTLSEADERASRLRSELSRRKVHSDVLKFCKAELLQENYFHAVLEATKSVAEKIRQRTGLTEDSSELTTKAFALGQTGVPFLAFNTLQTETELSEQKGLMKLFLGMFGTFRNPMAHGPKISW